MGGIVRTAGHTSAVTTPLPSSGGEIPNSDASGKTAYEETIKVSWWYSWKGGAYSEFLIFSHGIISDRADLFNAGCNTFDEDLAFAEAGVVGC